MILAKNISIEPYNNPKQQIPGISPISETEIKILDSINVDKHKLSTILTTKAVFGGTICGIDP